MGQLRTCNKRRNRADARRIEALKTVAATPTPAAKAKSAK